jgi:hypothetical protein
MALTNFVLNGQIGYPSQRQLIAASGKYFLITNPTIGTPVVGATITAWSATANGMFVLSNGSAVGGPNIILDRLIMRLRSTAPTGTLTQQWEAYNETGIVAGTTAVTTRTPTQVNTAISQTSVATAQAFAAGAITIPAAVGTRRQVGSATITTGVAVDGDTYEIQFGADGVVGHKNGGAAARATDPAHIVSGMDPIVIAPQTTTWLNMWWLTQAANVPSWEYALSWFEL